MRPEIHKLRVNVKSLAAEAKIIRDEIQRATTKEARESLHYHRMERVRPEARMAHLALAFARGKAYKEAESKARNKPSVPELVKKIQRFAWTADAEQKVHDWLRD